MRVDVRAEDTWWQRRSASGVMLSLLALWTGWVALQWWAYRTGDVAQLVVSLLLLAGVGTLFARLRRRPGGLFRGLALRRALKDGSVPRDVDTSWWPATLRAAIRQFSIGWYLFTCTYVAALGGVLVTSSTWADQPGRLAVAAGVGAILGALAAALSLPYQRRAHDRATALLGQLES